MRFKQNLEGVIPKDILKFLPEHFEVTGDITLIRIPEDCLPYKEDIADAIISIRKDVRTVLQKTSAVEGERRVGGFEFLKGEKKTETIHKEAGYLYKIDLASVFFSPKLSYERMRIASLIEPEEKILVPFSGCGSFAIPAADKGSFVIAVEKNPDACRYFQENLRINGLRGKAEVICGDALFIPDMFCKKEIFDRAIIPTAYGLDEALFKAAPLVKKGGIIHFYTFKTKEETKGLISDYKRKGLKTISFRRCGNIAPGVYRFVFDLKKKDNENTYFFHRD
ncbi:MAG: hypothetical protein JXQ82_00770 [Methanomicrobiaceae archaeon]|nr:hypothetical protein [Methanomicrobiaceae archaeon]